MFRGAVRGDLPQILKIYAHARAVMKASGNPTQWGDNFPPQELLEEDIDSNRLFLYVVNGQIEAVFAFILGAWSTARACVPIPTPTTRSCSICWKRTALPAAVSSMWQTARPALPTRSLPPPSRWVENRIHPQRAPVCGCRACHAGLRTQAFLFAPARSALRRSTVTERTKPRMAKPVLATNTDQRKTPMGADLNANL